METTESHFTNQNSTPERHEPSLLFAKSPEHREDLGRKGIRLDQLVEQRDTNIDKPTLSLLRLVFEQHEQLRHVEIVLVAPIEKPDTGGTFHRVQVDEQTIIPTIFIVFEDYEHMRRLKDVRHSSAQRVADMLGIDFSRLSLSLLRQFIVAHEIGHAFDYVTNYEMNTRYQGANVAEEWDLHYEANLLALPVSGFSPVELLEEVSKFSNLEDFLEKHSSVARKINTEKIKTLQDLLDAQEIAYRNSVYENYADKFATNFLKTNARELDIPELIDDSQKSIY